MIVRLTNEIFQDEAKRDDLDYLLDTLVRRRHTMLLDELPDTSHMKQTTARIIEDSYAASLIDNTAPHGCEVVTDASDIHDQKIFSVSEAVTYLCLPLEIVIENGTNDAPFVRAIIREYTRYGKSDFPDILRLRFGNAGGCGNVQSHITGVLEQHNNRDKFLRHYVILDGDKRYPTQIVTKHDNLIDFLDAHSIKYHILHKRNMENYLPIDSFPEKEKKNNKRWLDAFKFLTPEQRDHINIAGGFIGDLTKETVKLLKPDHSNLRALLPQEQQLFYATVSDTNFKILSTGYPLHSFKSSFPKGYDDGKTDRGALDSIQAHQAVPTELADIARDIDSLL